MKYDLPVSGAVAKVDKWVRAPVLIPGTRVYKILACWLPQGIKPDDAKGRWGTMGYYVGEDAAWEGFAKESHWNLLLVKAIKFCTGKFPQHVRRHPKHNPPE